VTIIVKKELNLFLEITLTLKKPHRDEGSRYWPVSGHLVILFISPEISL
jgi:hypothetical protein